MTFTGPKAEVILLLSSNPSPSLGSTKCTGNLRRKRNVLICMSDEVVSMCGMDKKLSNEVKNGVKRSQAVFPWV